MIDKINIISQNYFKFNCKDLREKLDELLKEAYMRGYSDGAEKMRLTLNSKNDSF